MADDSLQKIQRLRSKTGAGFMDCKRALEKASGDEEKAIVILREQGAATAAKRSGKATASGLVTSFQEGTGKSAVLIELNCETDFVARTEDFQKLLVDLAKQAATASPAWTSPDQAPKDRIQEAVGKLGENINLRRFARYDRDQPSLFSVYIHPSGGVGSVGVLLELGAAQEKVLSMEEVRTLGKDLAMQVAASMPKWVKKEDAPASILEQEKSIAREQAKRENKPEKIWDKIMEGKLQQFYQQFCLLEQPFIRDSQGKTPVKNLIEQVSKKVGEPLVVRRFVRYRVGEEE